MKVKILIFNTIIILSALTSYASAQQSGRAIGFQADLFPTVISLKRSRVMLSRPGLEQIIPGSAW